VRFLQGKDFFLLLVDAVGGCGRGRGFFCFIRGCIFFSEAWVPRKGIGS
jgi:hypothetical protein